jgi:hypothetical protein
MGLKHPMALMFPITVAFQVPDRDILFFSLFLPLVRVFFLSLFLLFVSSIWHCLTSQSEIRSRKQAALNLLNNMRQHSPKLVQETLLVSGELIRVAILWKEKWRKGLDEAYHQYYYER